MKFSATILAFVFAAATSARSCGINGAFCPGPGHRRSVASSGFTAKAREYLRLRDAEAPKEARAVDAAEIEVQI